MMRKIKADEQTITPSDYTLQFSRMPARSVIKWREPYHLAWMYGNNRKTCKGKRKTKRMMYTSNWMNMLSIPWTRRKNQ